MWKRFLYVVFCWAYVYYQLMFSKHSHVHQCFQLGQMPNKWDMGLGEQVFTCLNYITQTLFEIYEKT